MINLGGILSKIERKANHLFGSLRCPFCGHRFFSFNDVHVFQVHPAIPPKIACPWCWDKAELERRKFLKDWMLYAGPNNDTPVWINRHDPSVGYRDYGLVETGHDRPHATAQNSGGWHGKIELWDER